MVYSLFCAPRINTDTLVCYSDIVYSKSHIIDLIESVGEIVITADKNWLELWSKRFDNPLDDAESFKTNNNRLIEIGKNNLKKKILKLNTWVY